MNAEQRLRAMYDALPPGGAVVLKRSAIGDILGLEEPEVEPRSRDHTTDEVAELFGVARCTVLAWLHQGRFGDEGIGWYRLGKRYYIRPSVLENLAVHRGASIREGLRLPRHPATS